MRRNTEFTYIKIRCFIRHKSKKAVLVKPMGGVFPAEWIPFSLLGMDSGVKAENASIGDALNLYIPDWKVDDMGWEDFDKGQPSEVFER